MWKVSYIHLKGYRVSITYDTRAAAQQYIDDNALVWPLPGVWLAEVKPASEVEVGQKVDHPSAGLYPFIIASKAVEADGTICLMTPTGVYHYFKPWTTLDVIEA